jgi:hypothetical protein
MKTARNGARRRVGREQTVRMQSGWVSGHE